MNTNCLQLHVYESTRGNNILDLVMTTTDLSINGLEVTDKIGDHQMIDFSLEIKDPKTSHAVFLAASTMSAAGCLQRSVSQTLYHTLPKSTSPQELSHPEELNSQPTAERKEKKPAILSVDRMRLKQPKQQQVLYVLQLYTSRRSTGKMSVRQYSTSRRAQ
ncbi:hypothetical protein FHG87_011894 [Trinorchestia longiramus]|nr:hypothetical protein FHG87_011894 [Trinorchestia longiramus]